MKKIAVERCPHIVNMVGCCTQEEPLALVLELVSNGDLLSFLRASRAPVSVHMCSVYYTCNMYTVYCVY